HNSYHLFSTEYNIFNNTVMLVLKKTNGDWVKKTDPDILQIQFYKIQNFEVIRGSRSDKLNFSIDKIEELGYWPTTNIMDDWILNENDFNEALDLIIRFENDTVLRIKSQIAKLTYF
ncbi:MAG: hypothetical protein SH818_05880, partial [Saprospiraceae bacterium]|nr:hypothetical protein [Saprospiraceae bacterium]